MVLIYIIILWVVLNFHFVHMGVLSACTSVCYVLAWCTRRPEKGIRFLELELHTVLSSMQVLGTKTGFVGKKPVYLTTDPSLQPHNGLYL